MRRSLIKIAAGILLAGGLCLLLLVATLPARQPQRFAAAMSQSSADETATVPPALPPTATPVPYFSADCGWGATVQAFTDKNGNGKWDKGEQPLAGVSFQVDDVLNEFHDVASPGESLTSDKSGMASVFVFLPGCPQTEFEVYAVPPAGYVPTTPLRVHEDGRPDDEPYVFGFRPSGALPGMPGTGHP